MTRPTASQTPAWPLEAGPQQSEGPSQQGFPQGPKSTLLPALPRALGHLTAPPASAVTGGSLVTGVDSWRQGTTSARGVRASSLGEFAGLPGAGGLLRTLSL